MEDNKQLKSVITCDMEGRIETFNEGAERLFGYSEDEVIGKNALELIAGKDHGKAMENLKKTLEAAGGSLSDVVSVTRYLTDVREQDDLNRVWASYLGDHLPTTTTVEVSRLATHPRCKLEISAIAVVDAVAPRRPRRHRRATRARSRRRT